MTKINTVMVKGIPCGLLAVVDVDLDVFVYAIPIETWESYELVRYQGVEQHTLPADIYDNIENGVYEPIQLAYVASL